MSQELAELITSILLDATDYSKVITRTLDNKMASNQKDMFVLPQTTRAGCSR